MSKYKETLEDILMVTRDYINVKDIIDFAENDRIRDIIESFYKEDV